MSYTVTKYPQGTFSWTDLYSKDADASKKFLTQLFGWTHKDIPTGKGEYTMFFLEGKAVAGSMQIPEEMKGMPSFWTNYVTVDDVDAMAEKVKQLGGTVSMPPMDVMGEGRMTSIADPTGAALALWQPKKHIGAQIVNTVGAMCWNELYTTDVPKVKKFYTELLGWSYEDMQMPDKSTYTTIQNGKRMNGGIMKITPEMGEMPPNWTVYFTVANIQEALENVKKLGGSVEMDTKVVGVGKLAVVSEPAGGYFMLIEMKDKPEEWEE